MPIHWFLNTLKLLTVQYNINGKKHDHYKSFQEDSLLQTTYHNDSTIEIDLLQSYSYSLNKSPFLPGPGDIWTKVINDE